MAEPNEELNEELSTDELKSVSGGLGIQIDTTPIFIPPGSGSGMTRDDWKKGKGEEWGRTSDGHQ